MLGDFSGCCIVDVSQSPEYRSRPSNIETPTIMRSSTFVASVVAEASDRLVLLSEVPSIHALTACRSRLAFASAEGAVLGREQDACRPDR